MENLSLEESKAVIQQIRPYLQQDGGIFNILELLKIILWVKLQGACGTCPHKITLKSGVEATIKSIFLKLKELWM